MRLKRVKARLDGVCITCCKISSERGCTTCGVCRAGAKIRMARMRERRKDQHRRDALARSHQAAGQSAYAQFNYIEASFQFEKALTRETSPKERLELYNALIISHQNGARPERATPWLE